MSKDKQEIIILTSYLCDLIFLNFTVLYYKAFAKHLKMFAKTIND